METLDWLSTHGAIAEHWCVLGQLTPSSGDPASIRTGVGEPGLEGAKAIARPPASTATHDVVAGQLRAVTPLVWPGPPPVWDLSILAV